MSAESTFPATAPPVGIIMGSRSDWATMKSAALMLQELDIEFEAHVVSAHRTPGRMVQYATSAAGRGLKIIIAGAGGAAHLPGMIAGDTTLPVIGVPIQSRALQGLDSLLSIAQMPGGVPVATMSIGTAGAKNAGLMAARILAINDTNVQNRLVQFIADQTAAVQNDSDLSQDVEALKAESSDTKR